MLSDIKQNFEKLIALYEAEKAKCASLSQELEQSRAAGEAYQKQIIDLERQIENLRLAGAFKAAGDSSTDARLRIDRLIKEVDKCISLLEKD
ncbi:MAG: hypothetical protein MJZ04_00950 [Bacteroidales bacterium]|nr:hypothetical protein [Candidatus Cryptobacteroides onthequi]MCQ2163724.1 hypothetical protein [Bacteroidales bacterium]